LKIAISKTRRVIVLRKKNEVFFHKIAKKAFEDEETTQLLMTATYNNILP